MAQTYQSERTTIRRRSQRGAYDKQTIHEILDQGMICHVGLVIDGQPMVIPTIYVRLGESIYLHGALNNRMLRALADGAEACVAVTLVDGWVLARSIFHHSMNYRSVVLFGRGEVVEHAERKNLVLRCLSEHLIPGRWADVRTPSEPELKGTLVVGIHIEEASAKIRTGPPIDDEADQQLPVWAGIVPLEMTARSPVPDAHLRADIPVPAYLAQYRGPVGVQES